MLVLNMTLASGILKAKSGTHSSNLNLVNQFVFPFKVGYGYISINAAIYSQKITCCDVQIMFLKINLYRCKELKYLKDI